jgi:hypothetical protein
MQFRRLTLTRRSLAAALVPLAVLAVLASGCSSDDELTADAVEPTSGADVAPVANQDHWHASFGVYVCDAFVAGIEDVRADTAGIHSHQDDLVHIHPWIEGYAGANAVVQVFADQVGLELADGRLGLPDGTVYADGDACAAGPGQVSLFVWGADAPEGSTPEIVTTDLGATRFLEDRQRFVLAFAPDGVVPPQPPSTSDLEMPGDVEPPDSEPEAP